jgi:hypothetical protein
MADDDSEGVVESAKQKATERVSLARGEVWLLRIAAATGVVSMFAHGLQFLHEIGLL